MKALSNCLTNPPDGLKSAADKRENERKPSKPHTRTWVLKHKWTAPPLRDLLAGVKNKPQQGWHPENLLKK